MSEPIHLLSLGLGVQSITLAMMAAECEIEPMPVGAIFADTKAEPRAVYDTLEWVRPRLPFPIYVVSAGDLEADSLRKRVNQTTGTPYYSTMIPAFVRSGNGRGMLRRKCTWDYKMTPIVRQAKKLARAAFNRDAPLPWVMQWIGISTDEAIRMKDSREKMIQHRWPLIEKGMSRRDCMKWLEKRGYPLPAKSACVFCPYHSDHYWRNMKRNQPEEFERAANYEKRFQAVCADGGATNKPFLHSSLQPLSEVDFSGDHRGQIDLFGNECEGMCGV